ncbi:unnamed protein product, partial [Choristocarpus tenellus]
MGEEEEKEEGGSRGVGGRRGQEWTADWMGKNVTALGELQLTEMSLPGTHDSGTSKMAVAITGPWASTQALGIGDQLLAGVRVLDLRVGYDG